MIKFIAVLCVAAFAGGSLVHAEDPRLEKEDVSRCFEQAKNFLRSSEYYGEKKQEALIGACRDADSNCVSEVGDSLHPSDALTNSDMVKIIKACRGRGMGNCFASLKDATNSSDRREVNQVLSMLKKCE